MAAMRRICHVTRFPRRVVEPEGDTRHAPSCIAQAQRDTYLGKLQQRFEIEDGCHSHPEGRHVIFYLVNSQGIDIIGVVHQHMDVISYFDKSP